jgi:hypothetical protein
VDEQRIGASLGKLFEKKVRVRNHQVRLQRQAGDRPQRLYDHRAHRNVGHEVPIHDIHMDPVGPRLLRLFHLLTQTGKVSGED